MYGKGYRVQHLRATPIRNRLDRLSSLEALLSALDNLDALFETIDKKYAQSLKEDDIQKWEEKS